MQLQGLRTNSFRQTLRFIDQRPSSILRRTIASAGTQKTPKPFNEPNLHYAKSSPERQKLEDTLSQLRSQLPVSIRTAFSSNSQHLSQILPQDHQTVLANYTTATQNDVSTAIESALQAKQEWADMPFVDRAGIFLRAAELVSGKYRFELMAATMLGQGKNAWQAEIDAAAELADFFRFNVGFAQEIYDRQPQLTAQGHAGRTDWRPLEGFVYAVSPFNFTAIGGNLVSGPALLGNVVIWKPAPASVYASHLVHQILLEAGLPPNVVQMVNGDAR
ncbi:Delta-1-pyrroline-5-carboxylate dehydrogenase, mitochondrial [Cyphellophora attinorum]|uniref:Delta-1-pyrroline-5-carboxylate dehydrogenase, mitochondrial n=1 Tax=Cyphellophora attinorum TaxID=1664694 RepID=A0A0N1HL17_9EURO|nr:Delta-1-pyrroline-5-carboxylate dehydrogenase, mitochondrial [Phialophora attinorum]KPI35103.1 Delta-1-pyrroline-5-carboxylate dehydrogenase, mitochondrial [Phialophora attinorum]